MLSTLKKRTVDAKREFYMAQELADRLKFNIMTIYRYINAGKLKLYKLCKEFRIERAEFEHFLTEARTK